ncbi:MAG: DNA-binding protein [Planctomycetota bacterium]|nr:MAG: DNA-binding protein [Planctomycetota bacterium]REJ92259.1 MAG: DNA-binding protein [Planctomycetota bacterium]REK29760.1 MAG: DNA-binding protein [Planctomycetota bacterium]REK30419.1 MAG: DNA-binding protein [Planctomycetota bacterium]
MAKKSAKSMTKTEVLNEIAEKTDLSKKQVASVFDELADLIGGQLGKKGPGVFTIPGLVKLRTRIKPAVPAGMRRNPFTGEEKMMPAKPASRTVRATPLKKLKDMV